MTEAEMLQVWDAGSERDTWGKVRAKALAENRADRVAMADERLAALPSALQALAANVELVTRLTGSRWFVIMYALEGGASWADVAEALRVTVDEARAWYTAAIARQEEYVGDLHDAARAHEALEAEAADPRGGDSR